MVVEVIQKLAALFQNGCSSAGKMFICDTCEGKEYYIDAGFFYCNHCQTRCEQYYEQESGFYKGEPLVLPVQKRKKRIKKKIVEILTAADTWTSWEAFNQILYGMTQELKNFKFVPEIIENLVLMLWACQLNRSEVGFLSIIRKKESKLGILYKPRDLKVLYGLTSLFPRKKHKLKRLQNNAKVGASLSETLNQSLKRMKKNIINSYYKEHLLSQTCEIFLAEDIHSLEPATHGDNSEVQELRREKKSLSNILTRNDYHMYKTCKNLKNFNSIRYGRRWKLNYFCKSKLLGIIHLALLLLGNCVQLGDLLRFIRESHLSFAKVTHFLPEGIKLSRGDVRFIETVSDLNMPTHLKQRKIGCFLARSLGFDEIPLPNMNDLINRYCLELNLPEMIAHYSRKVVEIMDLRKLCRLKSKSHLPNFEALAVASVIFVLKLLFGLDGVTEVILSDLAQKVNSLFAENDKKLFVFNNWQKHVECRKALLENLYYPTAEKRSCNFIRCSSTYYDISRKENKDENRDERYKPYSQYYMRRGLLKSSKDILECLKERKNCESWSFPPSLTPQASYLEEILNVSGNGTFKKQYSKLKGISVPILNLLRENYKKCCIDFIFNPKSYAEILSANNYEIIWISKFEFSNINLEAGSGDGSEMKKEESFMNFSELSKSKNVFFIENPYYYWTLKLPPGNKELFYEFKNNVLLKTPINFQWLLTECSDMLELNPKELYKELCVIERRMKLFLEMMNNEKQ